MTQERHRTWGNEAGLAWSLGNSLMAVSDRLSRSENDVCGGVSARHGPLKLLGG
jgi:hypothetical protein